MNSTLHLLPKEGSVKSKETIVIISMRVALFKTWAYHESFTIKPETCFMNTNGFIFDFILTLNVFHF